MRVLLVDVDSTIPNLALMKLSSYHKSLGDQVELIRCNVSYYPSRRAHPVAIRTDKWDKTYVSAIFKGTLDSVKFIGGGDVTFGGTGVDLTTRLPDAVEQCPMDYSIYPDNDTAYGFISRGCDRKCYFCVVPQKEGRVHQVESDLTKIIGGFKKVKFMDNNFLQLPNHLQILEWLVEHGVRCQFNQGLDVRLITPENSALLARLNYMGEYVFAFDDWKYRRFIERQLQMLGWLKPWGAKFYVYVHPDMAHGETVSRIEWLRQRKMLPYVMRDIACWSSDESDFYTDLAAYANQPNIIKKLDFYQFCEKRHANKVRAAESSVKWAYALPTVDTAVNLPHNAST